MSAAKKLAAAVVTATAIGAFWAGPTHAQTAPGNPSGGTYFRQPSPETTPTLAPSTLGVSFDAVLRQWAAVLAARQVASAPTLFPERTVRAVKARRLAVR
jgi:hypothetical protein